MRKFRSKISVAEPHYVGGSRSCIMLVEMEQQQYAAPAPSWTPKSRLNIEYISKFEEKKMALSREIRNHGRIYKKILFFSRTQRISRHPVF
jgi:hypothetical protein